METARARIVRPASEAESAPTSRGKTFGLGAGIGLGLYLLRSVLKGFFKGQRSRTESRDLNELIGPYLDTGLYVAVTKDKTSVIATGATMRDAVNQAAERGCSEPVIMRAPSRKAVEDVMHY